MTPVVIVGGGMAGFAAARALRQKSEDIPLTLITDDEGIPYSKPALSTCFTVSRPVSALPDTMRDIDIEKLSLNLVTSTHVSRIRPEEKIVETDQGNIAYQALILALGSSPIRLQAINGFENGRIHSVNDLNSYRHFRENLHSAKHVAIIGAGLVGCEFASDLTRGGFAVTVVDIASRPLSRFLPPALGVEYHNRLSALGIRFRLEQSITHIEASAKGVEIVFESGDKHHCDVALSAVGIRPRIDLARESGLRVGRGIVVDRFLNTSAPGIHAFGDCSEYGSQILPYTAPLRWCAEALAETILSEEKKEVIFPVMPVTVKTPDCPISVVPPPSEAAGEWEIEKVGQGLQALHRDHAGSVRGFALLGEAVRKFRVIEKQIAPQSIWDIPS